MWILTPKEENGENNDSNCDIVITGDATISRKHCTIAVTEVDESGFSRLEVTDTSKTGTAINNVKTKSNQQASACEGDTIAFGKMITKFTLHFKKIIIVPSSIKKSEQKRIFQPVPKLGGRVSKEWCDEATHLVMTKLIFTIKVVYALACGKYIVTPKFFEELLDCCDRKIGKKLPKEKDFLPRIEEKSMANMEILFYPNENRCRLFDGKIFVSLFEKQYDRMKEAIEYSGGAIVLHERKDPKLLKSISSNQTIVFQLDATEEKFLSSLQIRWVQEIYKKLNLHNIRSVSESEVGLALLNNSLEKFCNPASNNVDIFCLTTDTQAFSQQTQTSVLSQTSQPSKDLQEIQKETKRKRISKIGQSSCSSEEDANSKKKAKLDKPPSTGRGAGNLVEIDGEDDDDFMFDESAFSNIKKSSAKDTATTMTKKSDSQKENLIDIDDEFMFDNSFITKSYTSPRKKISAKKTTKEIVNLIELDDDDDAFDFKDSDVTRKFDSPLRKTTHATTTTEQRKTKDANKNIIEIDDCDMFGFSEDETALTSTVISQQDNTKPLKQNSRLRSNKTTTNSSPRGAENSPNDVNIIIAKNTEMMTEKTLLSPGEFSRKVIPETEKTLISPDQLSRKVIPDSAPGVSKDFVEDQEDDDDSELNSFAFDVSPKPKKNTVVVNNFIFKETPPKQGGRFNFFQAEEAEDEGCEFGEEVEENEKMKASQIQHARFLKAACDSQTSSVGGFSPSIGEDEEKGEEESKHPTPISLATPMVTPSYATRDALISEEFPIAKKQDIRLCGWLTTNEKISPNILKSEEQDPDLEGIPRDLIQTSFKSLVVLTDNVNRKQARVQQNRTRNPKNTKAFKKQLVLGETSRKNMISRQNMEIYFSQENANEEFFSSFRMENDREERNQKKMTQMFGRV